MSVWRSKDSNIPESVDCAITDRDDIFSAKAIATFAMVEMTIDGALGFPVLHKVLAFMEMMYRILYMQ